MGGGLYCMVPDPKTNKDKVLAKFPELLPFAERLAYWQDRGLA